MGRSSTTQEEEEEEESCTTPKEAGKQHRPQGGRGGSHISPRVRGRSPLWAVLPSRRRRLLSPLLLWSGTAVSLPLFQHASTDFHDSNLAVSLRITQQLFLSNCFPARR